MITAKTASIDSEIALLSFLREIEIFYAISIKMFQEMR